MKEKRPRILPIHEGIVIIFLNVPACSQPYDDDDDDVDEKAHSERYCNG